MSFYQCYDTEYVYECNRSHTTSAAEALDIKSYDVNTDNNSDVVFSNASDYDVTVLSQVSGAAGASSEASGWFTNFELAMQLVLGAIVCVCGVSGNMLSIVVLRRDKLRRDSLFLLQTLAVADCGYVIVAFFRYPLRHLLSAPAYESMQPLVFPLLKTFQAATIWMLLLVTVDRYAYVSRPVRAHVMFTQTHRRKLLACLVFVGAFLYSLPHFFSMCNFRVRHACDNRTEVHAMYRHTFVNQYFIYCYVNGAYLLLLYILPLSALLYMNFALYAAIRRTRQRRLRDVRSFPVAYRSSERFTSDANATQVLVIVIVVFICCQTPELLERVVILVERHHGNQLQNSSAFRVFHVISEQLLVINSAVNFFIYVIFGRRFRDVMKETFRQLRQSHATAFTCETAPLQQPVVKVTLRRHDMTPFNAGCGCSDVTSSRKSPSDNVTSSRTSNSATSRNRSGSIDFEFVTQRTV